jgi:hypothetical protein
MRLREANGPYAPIAGMSTEEKKGRSGDFQYHNYFNMIENPDFHIPV